MPSQSKRAVNRLLAIGAFAAASLGGVAHAQADPFALPESQTVHSVRKAAGPGLSAIEVDGVAKARLVDLQGHGQALTIDAANARAAGLPVAEDATGQIPLASLKLYSWEFDSLRQKLSVKLFRLNDGANFHDLSPETRQSTARRTIAAVRVDYDLTVAVTKGGTRAAGIVDVAAVKGDLLISSASQIAAGGPERAKAIRLDSFVQTRLPGSETFVTVGDYISAGGDSQRAVRLGGIQLTSDFSTRPDLITTPLPAFDGSVAVPTNLDVLVADRRFELGELEPGEFTVRNVPINPGRGAMDVVLQDSLGREVTRRVPFYTSRSLLRPGLRAFAVNLGFVRRRYGIESNDYGPLTASAYYRRGFSPFLTLEANAGSTAGHADMGARGDFTLGNVALSSWEFRVSHNDVMGFGYLVNGQIESIGQRLSARAGFSAPSANYSDTASYLGDRSPPRQIFANVNFDLARVPVQISYVRRRYPADDRPRFALGDSEVLSASAFHSFSNRLNATLIGGLKNGAERSFFVSAGLTMRLGRDNSFNIAARRDRGQQSAGLSFLYNDLQQRGIRAQTELGTVNDNVRASASAQYESRWTDVRGSVVASGRQFGAQVSATGAVIVAGANIYARSRSQNGYLLVRADQVEGIPVKVENRYVGKTDRNGLLLIQDLRTYVPQQVVVDAAQLPTDTIVRNARNVVTVPGRAIGLIDIAAHYYRPVVRTIIGTDGKPVEAGSRVTAVPSTETTLVGYEGMVEVNAASGDRSLLVEAWNGNCVVELPAEDELRESSDPLTCRPTGVLVRDPSLDGTEIASID